MTPEQDTVFAEIEIAAPPERVFQALTDPKQLFIWWGTEPSVILLQFDTDSPVGGKYNFRCAPRPGTPHGPVEDQLRRNEQQVFECHGEVLECVPPRLLVWSWLANWPELSPPDNRGSLGVDAHQERHSGPSRAQRPGTEPVARKAYTGGWQGVLRLLQTYVQ